MNKKCVYTVITGGYENPITPEIITPGWDYVIFSDKRIDHEVWKNVTFTPREPGPKGSREPKILPHIFLPDYDVTVYADANYLIKGDMDEFIGKAWNLGHHCGFEHPHRDCVYMEGDFVIKKGKDSGGIVGEWMGKLKSIGYPDRFGLYENGIIIRDNTVQKETYLIWDTLIRLYSYRDQLSFMPSVWMHPMKIWGIDYDIKADFFELIAHRDNR